MLFYYGKLQHNQRGKTMRKPMKNVYLAALRTAIGNDDDLDKICQIIGGQYESNAYCWLEDGRTEREIVTMLRKIGYDIPKDFQGSDDVKFNSTIQED